MNTSPPLGRIDAEVLHEVLKPGLEAALSRPVDIVGILAGEFDASSSFSAGRIEVVLASGLSIPVFAKDLNPANQLPEARVVREATLTRSRREVYVYREILGNMGVGTPTFYAALWDESKGWFWLFLEDAGPKRLSRLGDFALWMEAAGWLGRFHRVAARLEPRPSLPVIELDILRSRCLRAASTFSRLDPAEQWEVECGLEALDRHLEDVFAGPQCMIHGEFFGKNVVIRPSSAEERIAVVDWETAALGSPHLDLVSLTAGRWTLEQRLAMRRAYFDMAMPEGNASAWQELNAQLDSAALVNAFSWLGWWSDGDDAHINRWLSEAVYVTRHLATPK